MILLAKIALILMIFYRDNRAWILQLSYSIPYTQNNWRVKYLANQSKIVVGVTLIWRKTVAVSKCNSYRPKTVLFKFGGLKIIRQTAKLNTPPFILRIR